MKNIKKFLMLTAVLSTFYSFAFGQNGTYNCSRQAYRKADNSEKHFYDNKLLITINIEDGIGGFINMNYTSDGTNIRYDILSQGQTYVDKEKRTITKTYKARMTQLNIPIAYGLLISIISNMDNNNIVFWIYNDKYQSYNEYFDLNKTQ
jgi:hypothetical protein